MQIRSLGLYLHIPFCVRKCRYCDFLSAPASEAAQKAYVEALCRQIHCYGEQMKRQAAKSGELYVADTVFFGGGTPSLLKPEWMGQIMEALRQAFPISPAAEISMECNPATADFLQLKAYRELGINRLSIGLQSANNEELKLLGRIHTFEAFAVTYQAAREAGFDNINIDIISALPGQTVQSLAKTLTSVLALEPEHISAYSLIIEEGTPFFDLYQNGEGLPDEDMTIAMDELIWRVMQRAGYERYEISNYAKPGFACRHNLKYWSAEEYLGFGIGAASYMKRDCGLFDGEEGFVRCKWISDRETFIHLCTLLSGETEKLPNELMDELTYLDKQDEIEEYMFLGFRKSEGISVSEFEARFGRSFAGLYGSIADRYLELGLMRWEYDRVWLTEAGMEVSNQIMSEFLGSV